MGSGGGLWLVWMEWRPAGWLVCLPRLIFPCTIKPRSSLLSPAHPGGPGKTAVKWLLCECVCVCIEWVQALADISHSALCCHNNETHAPIANSPNSAQLGGTPTIPPSYIWVHAVVWECDDEQTDRHTHTHTDVCDQYIFCVICDSREV